MNWFKKLFGMIGSFFKKAAITVIGQAADQIQDLAIDVVKELAGRGIPSAEKRGLAVAMIRARVPNIATAAINLAIEMAWAVVSEQLGEKNEPKSIA